MDSPSRPSFSDEARVLTVNAPAEQRVPLVFASPHSGRDYPPAFLAQSRLDPVALRRSEDSFVDELFGCVVRHGAPLIAANFPRAFCDPNREPYELDPAMFSDPLPIQANTRSPRVAAGLGTIARQVAAGAEIYREKLSVAEVAERIDGYYRPYHARLSGLLEETRARFGRYVLIDCHSMPSMGRPFDHGIRLPQVDVVLGDCYGAACAPSITAIVEDSFRSLGYRVVRNTPYAGGFITRHYGQPRVGCHALQIEVNRGLYMEELAHVKTDGFAVLARDIETVVVALTALVVRGGMS